MDLQFEWEEVEAFVRQPDGSLFSWCERFHCYHHLIYGIVSRALYTNTNLSIFWCFLYIILCLEVFVSTNKQIGFYILKQSNIAQRCIFLISYSVILSYIHSNMSISCFSLSFSLCLVHGITILLGK